MAGRMLMGILSAKRESRSSSKESPAPWYCVIQQIRDHYTERSSLERSSGAEKNGE